MQKWRNKVDEKWPNRRSLHCVFPSSPCFWWAFIYMGVYINFNFCQQKKSTYTQYSSSEISWKANSHDAIPAVHHRACCSKSDRSDAFTAHLRVSYKAPQIIPGAPLLPLYYSISLKISASKSTSLSPILLIPQIPSFYIYCHRGSPIKD